MEDPRSTCTDEGHVALPVRGGLLRDIFLQEADEEHDRNLADDDFASLMTSSMVAAFLNTASSPVSPGQSSPPLEQVKSPTFVPPTRPSSTPFPLPDNRSAHVCYLSESDYGLDTEMGNESSSSGSEDAIPNHTRATKFDELPTEVHEAILDHLFGYCISPTSSSAMRISNLTRSWSSTLRHCRRRELADLALVNPIWSILVQQRLYRHIKLKATIESIDNAMMHLAEKPHLSCHIKHLEIWFPVFQPTYGPLALTNTLALPTVTSDGLTNATYTLPANNCTLDEVFRFVSQTVPSVQVLTLEGGERRKAPKVVYFSRANDLLSVRSLEPINSVRTLVTRGQWNLIRDSADFNTVLSALPNLKEWQASYSKPKSKSYITVAEFMPSLPIRITNLSLCLENDYRREGVVPSFYVKVAMKTHICSRMAEVTSRLEHFSYTGRICHRFFEMGSRLVNPMTTRLRSIDLTVKNCCRHSSSYHESGSGIQELGFIEAFEKLVLSAVRSLDKFKEVEYLRIRFVDLGKLLSTAAHAFTGYVVKLLSPAESILPPLNPYFFMANGQCSGVWNDAIVAEMARVRPHVAFTELCESFGNISYSKDGRMVIVPEYPRARITSLKLANYRSLATRITIQ
ncbi:hypothetical protein C2857_007831 [Epichloe festucae Fl1]|uniref:Uncharacterized protein n=1 Tax=Epichloe festucae (strain Fl1) TaxID=877507 RepID=A0A7S9KMW3_EPIFF|nr:hypothetical protein C2857_007831 [Epichloe festucae Fl1]